MNLQIAPELPLMHGLQDMEYPVAREMQLVEVQAPGAERQRRFRYPESDKAIAKLVKADPFQAVVEQAVAQGLAEMNAAGEILESAPGYTLAKAKRRQGLNWAVDFKEFAFRLNGALVFARASVDFAPSEPSIFKDAEPRKGASAKFGVRFTLVEHPASKNEKKEARNLSDDVLQEFAQQAEVLSRRVFAAMQKPFAAYVRKMTKEKDLQVKDAETVAIFAAGTHDRDFQPLIVATETTAPKTLEPHIGKNKVAQRLATLAYRLFNPQSTTPTDEELAKFLQSKDVKLFSHAGVGPERGVFLQRTDKERAHVVGISDSRLADNFEDLPSAQRTGSGLMDVYRHVL